MSDLLMDETICAVSAGTGRNKAFVLSGSVTGLVTEALQLD